MSSEEEQPEMLRITITNPRPASCLPVSEIIRAVKAAAPGCAVDTEHGQMHSGRGELPDVLEEMMMAGQPWPAWVDPDRAAERILRRREAHLVTYHLMCAAFPNGCMSRLAWEGERNVDVYHLDELVEPDRRAARLLRLNGWRLDYGQWVCGLHPAPGAAEPVAAGSGR